MQAAALLAARHLPQWEVIDYASATKADVPSGTARELAERLGASARRRSAARWTRSTGPVEARGAGVAGTQVHSVRLPSFVVSTEVVFGLPDERLTIRHDAGNAPEPYVAGTLIAVRRAPGLTGLDARARQPARRSGLAAHWRAMAILSRSSGVIRWSRSSAASAMSSLHPFDGAGEVAGLGGVVVADG